MKKRKIIVVSFIYLIIFLLFLLVIPFIYGPSVKDIKQQARDADILLTQDQIKSIYEPIPDESDNAAPAIIALLQDFNGWCDFFAQAENEGVYQFKYNSGQENLAKSEHLYERYPEPGSSNGQLSSADMENLDFFIAGHQNLLNSLNTILSEKDRFFSEDWSDWGNRLGYYSRFSNLAYLKAAARLYYKQALYYISKDKPVEAIEVVGRLYRLADYSSSSHDKAGQLVSFAFISLTQHVIIESVISGLDENDLGKLKSTIKEYNYRDMYLDSIKVAEDSLGVYEFDDLGLSEVSFLYNTKLVKNIDINNYLKILIDVKKEIENRSISQYSTIFDDVADNNHIYEKLSYKLGLTYKAYSFLKVDSRTMEIILRLENVDRMINIALAQQVFYKRNNRYAESFSELKESYNNLDLKDLMSKNSKDDFIYELLNDKTGYIISSAVLRDIPSGEIDPLEQCRSQKNSFWSGGPYRFVFKFVH